MNKDVLKIIVKDGYEKDFENFCIRNNIFYKQYPLEILKTRYRIEAKKEQLKEAESYIKSIENMPIVSLD